MKRRDLTQEEARDAARLSAAWTAFKEANPGVTQEWLGRETGLGSQGAIGQYLRGVIPLNLPALLAFCRVLKSAAADISPRLGKVIAASDEGVGTPLSPFDGAKTPEGYVAIQRYELVYEAESRTVQWEIEPDEEPRSYSLKFFKQQQIDPANARRVKMTGDSMEPTLYDDDSALVDVGDTEIVDGKVYVLRYGNGFRIKRLMKRFDGSVVLVSDNKKYPEEVITNAQAAEFITILGRVRDRSGSGGLE